MQFTTPGAMPVPFEIPDGWWAFANMSGFHRRNDFYPAVGTFDLVHVTAVEPPRRTEGIEPFRKYKLLPILFAFQSPECALPPVELEQYELVKHHTYRVRNGFHRFYASAAIGYPLLPAIIYPAQDP